MHKEAIISSQSPRIPCIPPVEGGASVPAVSATELALWDGARVPLATIRGMGTAVPAESIAASASAELAVSLSCSTERESRKVRALHSRSGIESRGSVLLAKRDDGVVDRAFYPPADSPHDRGPTTRQRSERFAVEAPEIATRASLMALRDAATTADTITHVIVVTCTGFAAPGIDVLLIERLGLPVTTQRVQVGFMGCHGAINGLRVAQGLVAANRGARVLMCCVELCSLHYQYGFDPDRIVSGAIFADGAAAMVVDGEPIDVRSSTDEGTEPSKRSADGSIVATGSCLIPNSREAMTWRIGNHGFEMTLSAAVPSSIESNLKPFLAPWLAEHGESVESIGGWAVHPGGTRILTAVQMALALPDTALACSRQVLRENGNMSSATMGFVIAQFARSDQPKPWLMMGFGPGLEIEVALIR